MICELCPRACGALRTAERGYGACGMGLTPVVARAALHFDEEPVISAHGGSGAVFFSGCALKCAFCQNARISHGGFGARVSAGRLSEIYAELVEQGARNINLVSGAHFAPAIIESLAKPPGVPVIWNTGGYERVETLKLFKGRVQVYLPDLKYADAHTAGLYSGASDYFDYAAPAIAEMLGQTGPVELDKDGMILKGTIIRHLILPGQIENAKRALKHIAENCAGAWVSLMAQYTPTDTAPARLSRRITKREYDAVVNYMLDLGLEDGFAQDLSSADAKYTPAFDLTGI